MASRFRLRPDVLGHGAFRYPLVVECAEFRAHLTNSSRLPTAWVQLRSAYIHEVGVERAVEESVAVVGEIVALGSRRRRPRGWTCTRTWH